MMEPHDDTIPAQVLALQKDIRPQDMLLVQAICTIGRSATCDIVIARSTISRMHARIAREGPRYMLYDVGSVNGTFVNGKRLTEAHLLADGDVIGLGSASEMLRFADPDPTVMMVARLRYDDRNLAFSLNGQPLELTQNQFRLLKHLYDHTGQLCTRERCAEAIWGRDYDPGIDADALDRAVSNLRAIVRHIDPDADLIKTRRGMGYTLII